MSQTQSQSQQLVCAKKDAKGGCSAPPSFSPAYDENTSWLVTDGDWRIRMASDILHDFPNASTRPRILCPYCT
jgi:hypothetical protein